MLLIVSSVYFITYMVPEPWQYSLNKKYVLLRMYGSQQLSYKYYRGGARWSAEGVEMLFLMQQ